MASSGTEVLLKQLNILFACQVALPIIATAAYAARLWVRLAMPRRLGYDDWAMGAALNADSKSLLLVSLQAHRTNTTQLVRLVNTFYTLTMVCVKLSLGFFFLHIFNANQRIQRSLIYIMVFLTTASGVVWVCMIEGTCGIEFAFTANCAIADAFNAFSITWGILNALSDVVFTALSLNALWSTSFRTYIKVSAMALLAFAGIGGVVSIIRVYIVIKPTTNQVLQVLEIGRWSTIEAGIYITTGSMVTLRALLQKAWQRMFDTYAAASRSASTAPVTDEKSKGSKGSKNGVTVDVVERMASVVEERGQPEHSMARNDSLYYA
ncbi:hypothetical protein ANO11243_075530 [Dothideomycetidae sp. 11243]|nr:hypothetical protein ANO11243_075530 [fungal sp. No.11243]